MSKVMEQLGTLDRGQLREVVIRASYLLDPTAKETPAPAPRRAEEADDPDTRLVWAEMQSVLSRVGQVPPMSVFLRNRRTSAVLRQALSAVRELVREEFKAKGRAEKVKVIRLVVRLTATELARRDALNPLRLFLRLRDCERTVDRAFPGYRVSGLLPLLVQQRKPDLR